MSQFHVVRRLGWIALLAGALPCMASAQSAAPSPPAQIAVFDLELEDLTPASALLREGSSSETALRAASAAARRQLAESGRYKVIEGRVADDSPLRGRSLRDCGGCEASIAAGLGADLAMIGAVRRVSQTDYYIWVQIRDAHTGKLLDEQAANFAGGEEGWASGVRMLIRHQILPEALAAAAPAAAECRVAEVSPVSGFAVCVDPAGAPVAPAPREDL